jgi:hypothetical protein
MKMQNTDKHAGGNYQEAGRKNIIKVSTFGQKLYWASACPTIQTFKNSLFRVLGRVIGRYCLSSERKIIKSLNEYQTLNVPNKLIAY